ncbi:MAG: hypothetical protein IJS51_03710 [Treponema sp.]|nr:hypothetical protein [Treponema sp.]
MKKIFLSLAVAALVSTTPLVAQNHTCGIDIVAGIVGFDTLKGKVNGQTSKEWGIEIFPIKIDTYDCFLLNNHLGLYASVGIGPGFCINDTNKSAFQLRFDFMAGPAFGVDLGESSVRFQIGVPFHAAIINATTGNDETSYTVTALGFALTPQFRFTANKRCSFVLGADLMFDLSADIKPKSGDKYSLDNAFMFSFLPYLGLGINFGK